MKKLRTLCLAAFLGGLGVAAYGQKESYFKDGRLFIINSSHQDIAWMDDPETCVEFRDEHVITPALKRMEECKEFCFSVEDALSLKEYLGRHPDKYQQILQFTKEGRLEWGATYKQPYFSMYDGEALIRQTYFGRKWLKKVLPGCDFKTAWNEDVPGMALQFPQILAKAGIPYYQFSRHEPGFYKWYSPDGSSILGWTPGQYECSGRPIRAAKTEEARTDTFAVLLNNWEGYFKQRDILPGFAYIYSYDFSKPLNYDKYIEDWNSTVRKSNVRGLPYIQYGTNEMAMDYVTQNSKTKFDKLQGERPNVWLYIHGPAHRRAVKAARDASRVLAAAEKFSTFNAVLDRSFSAYPAQSLSEAWEAAIYPDHGWGGNKGVITDRLFREKYEFARDRGKEILQSSTQSIALKIKFNTAYPYAVTVFNSLSWERTDPVVFTLDAEGRDHNHLKLVDEHGNDVAFQLVDEHEYKGNRDEILTFLFVAEKVPALGYKTYYLVEGEREKENVIPTANPVYENRYYKLVLGNGGIESLYDKEIGKEYIRSDKFLGAELFSMKSVGNGAGEFTDVQQPTMEGFEKMSDYQQNWQCVETGPVRDVFQVIQPMKDTQVALRVILYKTIKRIDIGVDLNRFNGENWREFRLAFPVGMKDAKVAYEVPMGVVEVGKDEIAGAAGFSKPEQIYDTPCKDVHPREVQDWFSVSDGKAGMTISSDVAVFDYIDPTTNAVSYPILQPVLLASRKSCHGLGNYYLQPGNHSFIFSLFTHVGDWKESYQSATQTKQPLHAVISKPGNQLGYLEEQGSFGKVQGDGVIVSTVKKCEDDDSIVLRCYDIEGKNTECTFSLSEPIKAVEHTNIIEEEPVKIKSFDKGFSFKIGHHAIETFKIHR